MKFECTKEFRTHAEFFERNKCYTKFPKGTHQYIEFWKDAHMKCKYGMTNSKGITITGVHFFYLNFVQILAEDETTGRKRKLFPRFLDIDYDYFHLVERARKEKKGIILLKPRRTGFSYKNAAVITHEYNFYRDSVCVIGSFMSRLSENTMKMVLDNCNWLDKHTEWRKQRNPDTRDYIKARYKENIDGVEVWKGYNSEVQTITYKDNPFAAIGKSTSVFIFEECGDFSNLVQSYNITEPCWKNGENMVGIPILFGTGGSMEDGTREFHDMFHNPEKYNLLSFDNTWEEGKELSKCGWFVPATKGRLGKFKGQDLVDEDGNSNEELALESIKHFRDSKRGGDPKAIRDAITQYPLTPSEAFLRNKGNIFPAAELQEWLSKIETSKILSNQEQIGELYFDGNTKVQFKINPDLNPIRNFPLDKDDDPRGCVVIYERPEFDSDKNPYGLYIAGCDPYDQDKSGTGSLGSFFIYKTFYTANKTHNLIVAEYTGRPEFADEFYENCRKLCIYYNAKCLYENQLKGLKIYFEQKHCLHYLCEQPQIIKDIVKDSKVNRGYGIHMNRGKDGISSGIKDQCEIYLKQWLLEERETLEGEKILNLHTILSVGLLKELIAYDREGNYDRVIAFMLCILQQKEQHKIHVQDIQEQWVDIDPFFKKELFKKNYKSLY